MIHYNATFQTSTYQDAVKLLNESAAQAGLELLEITSVYISPELLHQAGHWNTVTHHTFEFRAEAKDPDAKYVRFPGISGWGEK